MADDYVGFDQWVDEYVSSGKDRWGVGVCWDYCETGMCEFGCGGAHPTINILPGGSVRLSH